MPEFKFDSLDALPEELRTEAKQVDGKYVVNLVSSKKLTEFRDTNIGLRQQLDQMTPELTTLKALVGADPAKFQGELSDLRTVAQQVKDGKLKGTAEIEAVVNERIKERMEGKDAAIREKDGKIVQLTNEGGQWKTKYERQVLHQQITSAVIGQDSVVNPAALPDILSRAESIYSVQPDGSLIPRRGEVVIYGDDGVNPMAPKEWLTKLVKDAPYLGKQSSGGGANGNREGADRHGMSQEAWSKLPPQERIRLHREKEAKRA